MSAPPPQKKKKKKTVALVLSAVSTEQKSTSTNQMVPKYTLAALMICAYYKCEMRSRCVHNSSLVIFDFVK